MIWLRLNCRSLSILSGSFLVLCESCRLWSLLRWYLVFFLPGHGRREAFLLVGDCLYFSPIFFWLSTGWGSHWLGTVILYLLVLGRRLLWMRGCLEGVFWTLVLHILVYFSLKFDHEVIFCCRFGGFGGRLGRIRLGEFGMIYKGRLSSFFIILPGGYQSDLSDVCVDWYIHHLEEVGDVL